MRLVLSLSLLFSVLSAPCFAKEPPVKIGAIAGLSGEYSAVFQNWTNGITLAFEEYKAKGKAPEVELLVEDDGFHPKKGLSAYKKLVDLDKIDALINGSTPTITAISPMLTRTTLPVIQFGEEGSDPQNDNILQIMPGNIEIERGLGAAAKERYSDGLALIYTSHPTFLRFASAFKEGYGASISEFQIDLDQKDFKSLLTKILTKKPSAIAILTIPAQGALIVKELWKLNKKNIPLVFDGSFDAGFSEYQRLLGDLQPLDEALVAIFITDRNSEFNERYLKRFGEEPGMGSDLGYDAFSLLMQNYDKSSARWLSNLKSDSFAGVSGKVEFDEYGIRKPEYEVVSVSEYRKRTNK